MTLAARGTAWLVVDGVERARVASQTDAATTSATIDLSPGMHRIDVAYVKPASAIGRIRLTGIGGVAIDEASASRWSGAGLWIALAWLLHAIAGTAIGLHLVSLMRAQGRNPVADEDRRERLVAAPVVLILPLRACSSVRYTPGASGI